MGWRIYYTITTTTPDPPAQATITRCVGTEARLTLPDAINGVPVTAIGSQCFCQPAGSGGRHPVCSDGTTGWDGGK